MKRRYIRVLQERGSRLERRRSRLEVGFHVNDGLFNADGYVIAVSKQLYESGFKPAQNAKQVAANADKASPSTFAQRCR